VGCIGDADSISENTVANKKTKDFLSVKCEV